MSPGAPRDNGPSQAGGADCGGSVVVGFDPSAPGGVALLNVAVDTDRLAERLNDAAQSFAGLRERIARISEAARQVAEAFELPPELVLGPVDLDSNEDPIRSTRAEFPDDPYGYGRRHPHGPMRWTPPPEGEDVPPCP